MVLLFPINLLKFLSWTLSAFSGHFINDSYITLLDKHSLQCMIFFQDDMGLLMLESLCKCRQASETSHFRTDAGKHAYACRHRIIPNALYNNSDSYPKNNTPKHWQASTQTWEEMYLNCLHSLWNSLKQNSVNLMQTKRIGRDEF